MLSKRDISTLASALREADKSSEDSRERAGILKATYLIAKDVHMIQPNFDIDSFMTSIYIDPPIAAIRKRGRRSTD